MAHLLVFWSFFPCFICWHVHFALASFVDACIFPLSSSLWEVPEACCIFTLSSHLHSPDFSSLFISVGGSRSMLHFYSLFSSSFSRFFLSLHLCRRFHKRWWILLCVFNMFLKVDLGLFLKIRDFFCCYWNIFNFCVVGGFFLFLFCKFFVYLIFCSLLFFFLDARTYPLLVLIFLYFSFLVWIFSEGHGK